MNRLIREPLVHFLALGALIFAWYFWLNRDAPAENEIFISKGQQEHLITMFTRTWQRPPTPEEYQGLLRDYLREELAYREGQNLGLDENDTIIRRRLRQKLELLTDDIVAFAEPADEDLQQFLDEHPERFRIAPRMDLSQIYFSTDQRGSEATTAAENVLDSLNSDPDTDWQSLGDPMQLPGKLENASEREVSRLFGQEFARSVLALEPGGWHGPVLSGYGVHLVRIENFQPGRRPQLEEVRSRVKTELLDQRRREATDLLYEKLSENYVIEIESLVEQTDPQASE